MYSTTSKVQPLPEGKMELQSDIGDPDSAVDQLHVKDYQKLRQLLTELEKEHRALESAHSIRGETVALLEEENALLRKQLTEFQDSHVELLADRRRCVPESNENTHEATHATDEEIKMTCDCSIYDSDEDYCY